jgi:hypothetical protein
MSSHTQPLRRLHTLVASRAPTDWGHSYIEDELAQDPESPNARCPRFAGIVEESGDEAVILAETETELAGDMAALFTNEIPIRPIEMVDLDTDQHRAAICEATVRFAPAERRASRQRDIRAKWPHSNPALDAIDIALIAERMDATDSQDGPLEGDYVVFADGVTRRISYHWTDGAGWDGGCQTSDGGRFHLTSYGCSFSGSLYPCVPTDSLTLTDEYRDGEAWIFHHNRPAGGNGVEFITEFRVYRCSKNAPR